MSTESIIKTKTSGEEEKDGSQVVQNSLGTNIHFLNSLF